MANVDIVLTEPFPMLSLALVTEPLRVANRELARQEWNWRLLSVPGGPVLSSSGLRMDTRTLDDQTSDIVVLLTSYRPESALEKPLLSWLRQKARAGAIMGCVDTGALVFAEAGLLSKAPAAAHFESIRAFREKYTEEMFIDRMFHVAGKRCSSAGGVATFDMTLGLIEHFNGRALALRVAEILTYRPNAPDEPQQQIQAETTLMRLDRNLARAVNLMLSNIQEPLALSEIAAKTDLPMWTLARKFRRHFGETPSRYYLDLRLAQARNLIHNSSYRIGEIALLCGFEGPESFARAYKLRYGRTASNDRKHSLDGATET